MSRDVRGSTNWVALILFPSGRVSICGGCMMTLSVPASVFGVYGSGFSVRVSGLEFRVPETLNRV